MKRFLLCLLGFLLCLWLTGVVSCDSLWTDEALTASYAMLPSLHQWFSKLSTDLLSDAQMPLYMLLAWGWEKIIGHSEWALRAPNIFYACLALMPLIMLSRLLRVSILPWIVLCHPFFNYYLNEARPYALVLACSSWSLYGLVGWLQNNGADTRGLWIFVGSSVALLATHMLGFFWVAPASLLIIWVSVGRQWRPDWQSVVILGTGVLLASLLGLYYAWTLIRGTGGARLWSVGVGNLAYAAYEFLGFGGFGPSRNILRSAMGTGAGVMEWVCLLWPYMLGLIVLGGYYGMILIQAWRKKPRWQEWEIQILVASTLGVASLLGAAMLFRWPFWGRHLTPFFPAFILLLCLLLGRIFLRPQVAAWLLAGLFAVASLNQRFNPQYAKDDYRSACRWSCDALARGQTVWWAASPGVASFYYEPRFNQGRNLDFSRRRFIPIETPCETLQRMPKPDWLVLSKPETYDRQGFIRSYLDVHYDHPSTNFQAFSIYRVP